jgi:glycine/D-amino acid oxidase-like deaminating enzyme
MGNLWVATLDNGWVRADQIAQVNARDYRYSGWPPQYEVAVRTTLLTGGWSESGDGTLDPVSFVLYRSKDEERVHELAAEFLNDLIAHAEQNAVLHIVDDEVVVHLVEEAKP